MIKANGRTEDGERVLLLGLSFANLDRMRAGDAIDFDGKPYGYPGRIHLFAGRDEQLMARLIMAENPDVKLTREPGAP